MTLRISPLSLAAVLAGLTAIMPLPLPAQSLVHQFQFNGDYADAYGGLPLTGNGASVGAGELVFDANQGPRLDAEASLAANYSIGLRFSLNAFSGWEKVVDFKSLTQDSGSYTFGNLLQFVYVPGSDFKDGTTPLVAGQMMDVVFTRNAADTVFSAYLNGAIVPEYSFADTTGQAVADLVSGHAQFRFFVDDTATGQDEAGSGVLDEIRIWDAPLAASQIPSAFQAVPEAGTFRLLLLGLPAVWLMARRRGGNLPA